MKIKLEFMVAVTAMITAIAAVVVSIVQTNVMRGEAEMEREHQRLSVKPSVWLDFNIRRSNNNDEAEGAFEFNISNKGLGPASIEYFSVKYQGQYMLTWGQFITEIFQPAEGEDIGLLGVSNDKVPQGYMLPNGETWKVFSLRAPSSVIKKLQDQSGLSELTVCACSIYGECWLTANVNTSPKPIKACEIDPKHMFNSVLID